MFVDNLGIFCVTTESIFVNHKYEKMRHFLIFLSFIEMHLICRLMFLKKILKVLFVKKDFDI